MTIAHCPKCCEQVSVPAGVSRQARMRCPLCSAEYLLDDALRSLPPLLVVVHDPEATASEELRESSFLAPALAGVKESWAPAVVLDEGSEDLTFEPSSPVSVPAFKFESSAVPAARGSSTATRSRARRKHGSPLRSVVQTIGGGVMGLVIAQFILWWMPGNWHENNRDPFELAAKVAPYAPYLVPIKLRGNAPTAQGADAANVTGADSSRADNSSAPGDDAGPKTSEGLDAKIPEFSFNANAPVETTQQSAGRSNKNKEKKETAATTEEFPLIGLNEPDSPAVVAEKPTLKELLGLRNPPAINIEEITDRLADVAGADLAWDTADNPSRERKVELITEIYSKLAKLGDAVAVIGTAQPEAAVPLQPVVEKLKSLAAQPEKLVPLGKLGGIWMKDHHDEGAVLVGVVLSHQSRGQLFETQIRLNAKSDPIVSVISSINLAKQLPVAMNVLVLGRLVSTPEKNLAGYEGDAESVLLYGVHVVISEINP